jgi:hypothetical protein
MNEFFIVFGFVIVRGLLNLFGWIFLRNLFLFIRLNPFNSLGPGRLYLFDSVDTGLFFKYFKSAFILTHIKFGGL